MSYQKRRYNRLVRQVLYGLKRQYGDTIAAYKLQDADTDYTTGIKTIQKTNHILTAIVIPSVISREVLQSISQISANKAMVYGGSFDPDQKTFIIDSRSLPQGWVFSNDDWIVYNNRRFEMKNIIQLDFQAGWIITGKAVIGQHAEQIFHLNTENRLSLAHEAASVPWTYWAPKDTLSLGQTIVSAMSIFYRETESTPGLDLGGEVLNHIEKPRDSVQEIVLTQSVSTQRILVQNVSTTLNLHVHHQFIVGLQAGVVSCLYPAQVAQVKGVWPRDNDNNLSLNQGAVPQKVIFRTTENTLGLQGEVNIQKTFSKPASSALALSHQTDLSTARNLTSTTDLSLTSDSGYQATLNRQLSNALEIEQGGVPTKVIFESTSSTIEITDDACQLATDLVSSWHLDETSGTRYDSWGSNDLTDYNTVDYATGLIGNAASFNEPTVEQLIGSNNATLQTGDVDFTFTFWTKLYDWDNEHRLLCKWSETGNQREFMVHTKTNRRIHFHVSPDGVATQELIHPHAMELDVWHFVVVYHDSVNDELGVSVDNDSFTTRAYSSGVYVSTADFTLSGDADLLFPLNGDIDAVHFWKRMLLPSEISDMYNDGAGRQIPPFGP